MCSNCGEECNTTTAIVQRFPGSVEGASVAVSGCCLSEIIQDINLEETKPKYYNKGIEVIKFIESWNLNFSRGSIVKYICRAGLKGEETELKDLKKARDYIDFEIKRIGK